MEIIILNGVPPHPTNLNVTAINKTAVLLTWDHPVIYQRDGIIRGYNINYTDSKYREFYLYKTPDASFTTAVIGDLEPATTYYFQASSRTRKTFGGGGAVVMTKTLKDVPTAPRNVLVELKSRDPPQVNILFNPPLHTYGSLVNYTIHWGVENGALRKERVEPYRLKWTSDFLDDNTNHEFKIFAVNDIGFGEPAIVTYKTPVRNIIVPPDVTVDRVKGPNNTTMLRVKWGPPSKAVTGYKILYRKFEWVYSGRWNLKEISDPNALSTDIVVKHADVSYIVVVQGTEDKGKQFSKRYPVNPNRASGFAGQVAGSPFKPPPADFQGSNTFQPKPRPPFSQPEASFRASAGVGVGTAGVNSNAGFDSAVFGGGTPP